MVKNEKCAISDSALCAWIDKDCGDCYVRGLKEKDDVDKLLENFEVTLSLLPEDFDVLQSDECQFCRQKKNKRAGYAIIDLGHNEPEHKKGMFFGIGKKVRQRIGSLMPVSISICRECRRALRITEGIKWFIAVAFFVISVVLVAMPDTSSAILNVSEVLPYIVIVSGMILGYGLGKAVSTAYMKAKAKETYFHLFDIPICESMRDNGWFLMQENPGATKFVFSRKSHTKKTADIKKMNQPPEEDFTQTSFLED